MPSQVRRDFIVYENKNSKLLSELIAGDGESLAPIQQYYVFEYVESLAKDLSKLSAKTNNYLLSNLLAMAMQEAQDSKNMAHQRSSAC